MLPGCLHSYCAGCLQTHAGGSSQFTCPAPNCGQTVDKGVDSLPANSYYSSIAQLDIVGDAVDSEFDKLSLGHGSGPTGSITSLSSNSSRFNPVGTGAPMMPPQLLRQSPPGMIPRPALPQYDSDWRPQPPTPSVTTSVDAWSKNPLNFNPLCDNWKPIGEAWGTASPRTPLAPPTSGSPSNPSPLCNNCSDGHSVTSRCRDCSEDLCDSCVMAHNRVKLTRDHTIFRYPDNNKQQQNTFFDLSGAQQQQQQQLAAQPAPATSDVLRVFNETVEKAKLENEKNISKAQTGHLECEKALVRLSKMSHQIMMVVGQVGQEVKDVTQQVVYSMQEREQALLKRLDRIKVVKLSALEQQEKEIRQAKFILDQVVTSLETSIRSNREMDIIDVNKKAAETIRSVQVACGSLDPHEDSTPKIPPDKITPVPRASVTSVPTTLPKVPPDNITPLPKTSVTPVLTTPPMTAPHPTHQTTHTPIPPPKDTHLSKLDFSSSSSLQKHTSTIIYISNLKLFILLEAIASLEIMISLIQSLSHSLTLLKFLPFSPLSIISFPTQSFPTKPFQSNLLQQNSSQTHILDASAPQYTQNSQTNRQTDRYLASFSHFHQFSPISISFHQHTQILT